MCKAATQNVQRLERDVCSWQALTGTAGCSSHVGVQHYDLALAQQPKLCMRMHLRGLVQCADLCQVQEPVLLLARGCPSAQCALP